MPKVPKARSLTGYDEILRRRPELKGKSTEAIERILRREARNPQRPRR